MKDSICFLKMPQKHFSVFVTGLVNEQQYAYALYVHIYTIYTHTHTLWEHLSQIYHRKCYAPTVPK